MKMKNRQWLLGSLLPRLGSGTRKVCESSLLGIITN